MALSLAVDNIKCGGCAHSIESKLSELEGVSDVSVDVEAGLVCVTTSGDDVLAAVKKKLADMGYPETGSLAGISAAGAKAKSFVSCAVGKMSEAQK